MFALTLVVALLIPWWWRAIEIPWAPGFGQINIPHRVIQAEVIDEFPDRELVVYKITCMTRSRLKDGILNFPQAFYPILTGLLCGAITGWVAKGAFRGKRLPIE